MGATLDSIVAVNISLQDAKVQQKGFGRGLVIGASNRMGSDLFRIYTGAAGMVSDGFLTTDPEYKAAAKYFSQPVAPKDIMVGYTPTSAVAQVDIVKVATATNTFTYVVTINGISCAYLSDNTATKAEIVAGLVSAINTNLAGVVVALALSDGSLIPAITDRFSITAVVPGTAFTVVLGTTKLVHPQYEVTYIGIPGGVIDNHIYTYNINGTDVSFTSGVSTTASLITAGLVAAINALTGTLGVTATDYSGSVVGTLAIEAVVEATPFRLILPTASLTALILTGTTLNATGGIANGLNAIIAAGGKAWYGLIVSHTRVKADIEAAAAWIEAASYGYIFGACSSDSDVLTNVSSDVCSQMGALSYLRTFYTWSDDQADFPEAAWMGEEFPKQPGSSNYAYKVLTGIIPTLPTVLTDAKIAILEGKNGNYYLTVGVNPITQTGKMVGGEWIDVVVGRDWLKANIQQAIFALLINSPKIGFDDAGIGALGNVLRGVLQQGVDFNILENFDIQLPLAASFSSGQKATRTLPSIPWTATLKGAINDLTINGTLTA